MNNVKLTDFTKIELQTMLDALSLYEAYVKHEKKCSPTVRVSELDRIQLLVTQVINAKVEVRMNERITLN